MDGKWSVVQHGKKKGSSGGGKLSKAEKRKLAENMPTLDKADPTARLQVGRVAYADGGEPELDNARGDEEIDTVGAVRASPKAGAGKKGGGKGTGGKPGPRPLTVKETLGELKADELRTLYSGFCATFPDQPSIWLSDLAANINRLFEISSEKDPTYAQESDDFPMCHLGDSVRKTLNGFINKIPKEHLTAYIMNAIQQVLQDVSKGVPTYGNRLLIQLIFRVHPTIVSASKKQFSELIKSNKAHSLRFLVLAWCLHQASLANFEVACRVLMDLMMPCVNIKTVGEHVVKIAEQVIGHPPQGASPKALTYRDFIPMLDLVYSQAPIEGQSPLPTNVPAPLLKRIEKLYPKFKEVSFLNQQAASLKNYFPSLYLRLNPQGPKPLNQELLSCLTHCLIKSPECFAVWTQMSEGTEPKADLLLGHVVKQWNWVGNQLERDQLRRGLNHFATSYENAVEGTPEDRLRGNAQILLQSRQARVSCLGCLCSVIRIIATLFAYLLVTAFLLVTLDVTSSGGWKRSMTHTWLNKSGYLPLVMNLQTKITPVFRSVGEYCTLAWQRTAPVLARIVAISWTFVQNAWAAVLPYWAMAWAYLQPYWSQLGEAIEKTWPPVVDYLAFYCNKAFDVIMKVVMAVAQFVVNLDWCCVKKPVAQGWEMLASYSAMAYNRAAALLASYTSSKM